MRQLILFLVVLIPTYVSAQWQGTSTTQYFTGGNVGIGTTLPAADLEISSNTNSGGQVHINNDNGAGRSEVSLKESGVVKAFLQYRCTTNSAFPGSLRLMTQSGTNADVFLGANGGHHIFIAGGQNGLTTGNVGIGTGYRHLSTRFKAHRQRKHPRGRSKSEPQRSRPRLCL